MLWCYDKEFLPQNQPQVNVKAGRANSGNPDVLNYSIQSLFISISTYPRGSRSFNFPHCAWVSEDSNIFVKLWLGKHQKFCQVPTQGFKYNLQTEISFCEFPAGLHLNRCVRYPFTEGGKPKAQGSEKPWVVLRNNSRAGAEPRPADSLV